MVYGHALGDNKKQWAADYSQQRREDLACLAKLDQDLGKIEKPIHI